MYTYVILLFFLLQSITCYSQYDSPGNYNWAYGLNGGLNFVNGTSPAVFTTSIYSNEAAAAVSDESGNLLFYTDGTTIWDRNHNIMPNGDTLTRIIDPNQRPGIPPHHVTYSSIQGALIVGFQDSRYYVFSITHGILSDSNDAGKLFYSVVDMSLNNGYGDVVPNQKGILLDSLLLESMVGIRGDRGNAWVLVHSRKDATFKAFETSCNGISPTPVVSLTGSYIPSPPIPGFSAKGILSVAPNRRKIAMSNFTDTIGESNLELFSFNPSTGIVSDPISLSPWPSRYPVDTVHFFCTAFSPNSNLLYSIGLSPRVKSANYEVYQHNLSLSTTTDIINSRTFIDSAMQGLMRLGPDGRIYMVRATPGRISRKVCRINNPDALDLLCDFEPDVLAPYTTTGYVDSVPTYFLGLGSDAVIMMPNSTDTLTRSYCIQPCFSDTLIQYPSGYHYLWNTGATTPDITIDATGTYRVLITGGCNIRIDTYHVYINNSPQITTTQGCSVTDSVYAIARFPAGDTVTYKLTWRDQDDNILKTSYASGADSLLQLPGDYSLQVSVTAPCSTLQTCERTIPFIIESPLPYEASFTIDSVLCQYKDYIFENTSTGNIGAWHWDFGDGNTSNQYDPNHIYTTPGHYRVTLIGSNTPCYDTFYRNIIVDTLGEVSFKMDIKELCTGENVLFVPNYTGQLNSLYWNLDNNNSLYKATAEEIQHAYDEAGIYLVTLTGKFRACPDTSFSDTIKVHPLPVVNLGNDSVICLHGAPITIQNRYRHDEGYQYVWNTGATTSAIIVRQPGTYWLRIRNAFGCTTQESIRVEKECYTNIPNAFTPNGDGVNDYFFPRQLLSRGVRSFRMQVFNRWGEKVFETVSTDGRGWDGKVKGKEQPGGVYVYVIDVELDNDRKEKYEGNMTLIR